jgi:signal transduction histidine kinase
LDRPTVLIISDETEFARVVTDHWRDQRNSPSFALRESAFCGQLENEKYDLAIVGCVRTDELDSLLNLLASSGKPTIHVSKTNGSRSGNKSVMTLPEISGWAEILPLISNAALECHRTKMALAQSEEGRSQLEQDATLGRYMLEARHNLNNALTSVLGNSDLLLLDGESLAPNLRAQVETIRNMGMRMNEIMQRFSSLQKEMQLVEQQVWRKKAKSAGA